MPTRTIYLNDEELELYNKIKKKVGNMSNFIVKAMRQYMRVMEMEESEHYYPSYVLYHGKTGAMRKIRIEAIFLSSMQTIEDGQIVERHLYLTRKENILLYERRMNGNTEEATFRIFSSIEDLLTKVELPNELVARAQEKLNLTEAVYLDV
jgi:hypothetical protein